MDDSQSPGDIVHASALNDGQLLFTPLSNYLYRFVSVRLSAFWTRCFFRSVVENTLQSFCKPTEAEALFFRKANKYTPSPVVYAHCLK